MNFRLFHLLSSERRVKFLGMLIGKASCDTTFSAIKLIIPRVQAAQPACRIEEYLEIIVIKVQRSEGDYQARSLFSSAYV